jgi:sugar transferase (PEP-CTERM/EpsH1 system associated)
MQELLFLAHRFPYPPDKGEKIRSWNLIRHLARRWRVHLGCLSVDGEDARHMAAVRAVCGEVASFPISPRGQKLRALARLRPGRPLMLDYYGNAGLAAWVKQLLADRPIALGFACSTPMAQYFEGAAIPWVLDMVDVDSEKFAAYAAEGSWPMRHVWAREARTLLAYEEQAVRRADLALLVSEAECRRFDALAPRSAGRVFAVQNGVDLDYFHPGHAFPAPWEDAAPRIVFTGHMDYPPNAEAAIWFAGEVMPLLRRLHPAPRFAIVGANPLPAVQALAAPDVQVTGRVPDVRPWLAHAAACVAPLRIARGIQNKVLEAMAMGRPVVATGVGIEGLDITPGEHFLQADTAEDFAAAILRLLDSAAERERLALAARARLEARFSWAHVARQFEAICDRARK